MILQLLGLPFYFFLELYYFIFQCRPIKKIEGEHILITGAGQGIGAEFALQLARLGNTIHCVDINDNLVKEVAAKIESETGEKTYSYKCDLTNSEDVQCLFDGITKEGFEITMLINNAGVAFGRVITDLSLTQIQHSMTVNIVSNLWLIKLFLPAMLQSNKGHIVNMASMAGRTPLIDGTDYCAAKAGSIHTINQLRVQYSDTLLKFSVVCPFFVKTKMIDGMEDVVKALDVGFVVEQAIKGIMEDREMIMIPSAHMKIVDFVYCNAPLPIRLAMENMMRAEQKKQVKSFVGHKLAEKIK